MKQDTRNRKKVTRKNACYGQIIGQIMHLQTTALTLIYSAASIKVYFSMDSIYQ